MEVNHLNSAVGLPALNILSTAAPDLEDDVTCPKCSTVSVMFFGPKWQQAGSEVHWELNFILNVHFLLVKRYESSIIFLVRFSAPCNK